MLTVAFAIRQATLAFAYSCTQIQLAWQRQQDEHLT